MASANGPSSIATSGQYTGIGSLGSSTFSLFADTEPLDAGLARAERSSRDAGQKIGKNLGKGSDAATALLYLGQTADDLQYGFRSIVNNIPTLVAAMGGGAGVAGAVGIAAVAINQAISHLDELKAAAGNSEALVDLARRFQGIADALDNVSKAATGSGVQDLVMSLLTPAAAGKLGKGLGVGSGDFAAGRAAAREHAAGQEAAKDIGKVQSQERQDRAKLFKDALEAYGGGEKLLQEYTQRLMNGNPALELGRARDMAASAINEAMQGGKFGGGQFGGAFEKEYDKVANEAADKAFEKVVHEIDRVIKEAADAKSREAKELNQAGAENEARLRAQLEDEQHEIRKRMQAAQDKASEMKQSQTFGSTREYLGAVSSGGANAIRKQQLDVQKGMKKELEKVNERLHKLGQARFG